MRKLTSVTMGGMVAAAALAISFTVSTTPAHATATPLYSGGGTLAELFYRDMFSCYGSNSTAAPVLDNEGKGAHNEIVAGVPTGTKEFSLCKTNFPINSAAEFLYVGVGSGNGKASFVSGNSVRLNNGKASDANPHPYSGDFSGGALGGTVYYGTDAVDHDGNHVFTPVSGGGNAFPGLQFAGSDDPLNATDINSYYSDLPGAGCASGGDTGTCYGPPVQMPTVIVGIGLAYNGTDSSGNALNLHGVTPVAKLSGTTANEYLDIDTNMVCGIMGGNATANPASGTHATPQYTWDTLPTTYNASTPYSTASGSPIRVVYRNDAGGSGTMFIFSNGLLNQCGTVSHHTNSVISGLAAPNYLPDSWISDSGATLNADGSFTSSDKFFINLFNKGDLPTSWIGGNGSGGVQSAVEQNDGTIGILSPGFIKGIAGAPTGSPPAAAILVGTKPGTTVTYYFAQPLGTAASQAMASANPPSTAPNSCPVGTSGATGWAKGTSPDGVCADNPVNWGVVNPIPTGFNIKTKVYPYPFSGFTFADLYSCYSNATEISDLVGSGSPQGLWYYHLAQSTIKTSAIAKLIAGDGFAPLPSNWTAAIQANLATIGNGAPTQPAGEFADGSTCNGGA